VNLYTYVWNDPLRWSDRFGLAGLAAPAIPIYVTVYEFTAICVSAGLALCSMSNECVETLVGFKDKAIQSFAPAMSEADDGEAPKSAQGNTPKSSLPRAPNGDYLPDSEAEGAHTALGGMSRWVLKRVR
jgi:hypothetical protein